MPFNPKYKITEKILNNLTLIASAREIIEQAYLVPKWEAKLRRQALRLLKNYPYFYLFFRQELHFYDILLSSIPDGKEL